MPRDLPIGNENYLIAFDLNYQIADIFYPHVGMENHSFGHIFRFGVFCDGEFSWTSGWKKSLQYSKDTLVTNVTLTNDDMQLRLDCSDCVDFVSPIYTKYVAVSDLKGQDREVRLFFAHDFHLGGTNIGNTAYYDPYKTHGIIHYKAETYFLMNCLTDAGEGVFQYACGITELGASLGTWKDAEDGYLSGNPIAQGSVDSVLSARLYPKANGKASLYYWMIAGKSYDEVARRNSFVRSRTPQNLMKRTADFWELWSRRENIQELDLGSEIWNLYRRSLLIANTQIDGNGAIIAANDSDILQLSRDTYSYMWPRDGSLVTMALDDAGYHVLSRRFFEFCSKIILNQGWFFHKYQPDGSAGSSWHPWVFGNQMQLPIQEDETALVLIALWNHFTNYRDVDFVKPFYRPIVKSAAKFMTSYRDPGTNLPLESYDLWEERRGVFTYTTSAVYAGLVAASNFCGAFGEIELQETYTRAANEIKDALIKNLYDPALGRFLRGCELEDGKTTALDSTIDSSLAGIFLFGVLSADDPMVTSTMKQIESKLTVKTPIGGLARYEQDRYQALEQYDATIPGNPWFVTTLWLCDWYIESSKKLGDLKQAQTILSWAAKRALPSGVMAEQMNPHDGMPISVSPLTWSHGTFIDSVNRYSRKYLELSK